MNHRDPGNSSDSGESEVIVNLEILVNMVFFLHFDSGEPGDFDGSGDSGKESCPHDAARVGTLEEC